ncbi:hypothetical protein JCM6882_006841 [Rhodosporidiobolus microsporus]
MSANFYLSSHANHHLHPRAALLTARIDDLRHATEQELAWIDIWSAGAIQKICKRLQLRQQVVATAVVFFRRFYLRNAYCETDPALVAAACCYVAAKAEETPVHVKSAVGEARVVFNDMSHPSFPSDNHRLAEMEFYLLEELDFHLVVYHPYRALSQLTGRDGGSSAALSVTDDAGKKRRVLEMDDTALQMAWFIINDTYRSLLPLLHPPHLIALAAIYLAFALHPPAACAASILPPPPTPAASTSSISSAAAAGTTHHAAKAGIASRTRRASQDATASSSSSSFPTSSSVAAAASTTDAPPPATPPASNDPISFLAALQVDQHIVLEVVQEIVSLYEVWAQLEGASSSSSSSASASAASAASAAGSPAAAAMGVGSKPATPQPGATPGGTAAGGGAAGAKVGPDERVLGILKRMQDARMREVREERGRAVQRELSGVAGVQGGRKG